jgi:hypothetical protein
MPSFLPYGAGGQPAGWTPPSAYYPVSPALPYVVYQDPQTGLADSGRLIDQGTRRFVFTSAGNTQGMSSVAQCVLIAWGTLNLLPAVPTFSGGWQNKVQSMYASAVRYLTQNKLMAILSYSFTRYGANGVKVVIQWRDLTTGLENTFQTPGG